MNITTAQDSFTQSIEKLLANGPDLSNARNWYTPDADLNEYLERLLADVAGCRSHTWSRVSRHSAHPGVYSARPCTDSCKARGCPTCGEDEMRAKLEKHRDRIRIAYPSDGTLCWLRLIGPTGLNEMRKEMKRFRRSRPVARLVSPMFGQMAPGANGEYAIHLLGSEDSSIEEVGRLWAEFTGGSFSVERVRGDAFDLLVDLRIRCEAAVFTLVETGVLDPVTARQWLIEENGKKRTVTVGGFMALGSRSDVTLVDDDVTSEEGDKEEDPQNKGESVHGASPADSPTLLRLIETRAELWRKGDLLDVLFEESLRKLEIRAAELADGAKAQVEIERYLADLPTEHWNCTIHERCREIETDLRIRTRVLETKVHAKRATRIGADFVWREEDWPGWRRAAIVNQS